MADTSARDRRQPANSTEPRLLITLKTQEDYEIYKNNPKTWEKLEKEWNSKYFPNLNVKIKTNLKISATGSLVKTIKEDKS